MQQDRKFSIMHLAAGEADESPASNIRSRLEEVSSRMDETHTFVKGQCVRWKAGLRNKKYPDYGEPAIVREVLSTALFDTSEPASDTGSPYFGEPLTLVVGVFASDGDFLEYRYDARRFEPCED